MELRSHARILNDTKWFILVLTLLVGLAAFIFAITQPVRYKAVVSFELMFGDRPETLEYEYGAYYDLQAAEIFGQHMMSWFRSPAFIAEIYEAADQGYEIETIPKFTGRFQAKQYSAQQIVVEFYDHNPETAEKLGNAVTRVVERHAKEASSINDESVFVVKGQKPVVAEAVYNIWLVTVVGVVAGLILAVILVYLREYFRQ